MSRRLASLLPAKQTLMLSVVKQQNVRVLLGKRQVISKEKYDRTARPLEPFNSGEKVYVRFEKRWVPAVIETKVEFGRSYWIKTSKNQRLRRNRQLLWKRTEQGSDMWDDGEEDRYTSQDASSQQRQDEIARSGERKTRGQEAELHTSQEPVVSSPQRHTG